jgi:hypothetical protein
MTCTEFMHTFKTVRPMATTAAVRAAMRAHMQQCPTCTDFIEAGIALAGGVDAVVASASREEAQQIVADMKDPEVRAMIGEDAAESQEHRFGDKANGR